MRKLYIWTMNVGLWSSEICMLCHNLEKEINHNTLNNHKYEEDKEEDAEEEEDGGGERKESNLYLALH